MPRVSMRNILLAAAQHELSPAVSLQDSSAVQEAKHALRTNWKWAYVSHFIFVFEPMLQIAETASIADLEDDLAAGTTAYVPRILIRLLTCLTHDRKITIDNYQNVLFRQYMRRDPDQLTTLVTSALVLDSKSKTASRAPTEEGTPDIEPDTKRDEDDVDQMDTPNRIEWVKLSLEEKLDVLYTVCEWHFLNPTRLRSNMKYDDEWATWRIEPIGYDASLNGYYLLGGDRIWIQRALPKRPKKNVGNKKKMKAPLKVKKQLPKLKLPAPSTSITNGRKRSASRDALHQSPRASKRPKRGSSAISQPSPSTTRTGRPSRAAADNANKKLAALPQTTMLNARGTRTSRRLRGTDDNDLWQEIPPEWLHPTEADDDYVTPESTKRRRVVLSSESEADPSEAIETDAFGSDGSELTELSDASDFSEEEGDQEAFEEHEVEEEEEQLDPPLPEGFIEWETLVITLAEWEAFAPRFEKSTNHREKAFYKVLTASGGFVQSVTDSLKEAVKKKVQEEAITHRKRSSRLAIKENEREEARVAAQKKAEEDEKLERARRAEARAKKEEEARRKREEKREERRRLAEQAKLESEAVDVISTEPQNKPASTIRRANGALSGVSTPTGTEDWELDCELCGTRGINVDDGTEITCCEKCGKWQHVWCHDQQDKRLGHSRRDWAKTEFRCRDCTRSVRGIPPPPPTYNTTIRPTAVTPTPYNRNLSLAAHSYMHPALASHPQLSYPSGYVPYAWPNNNMTGQVANPGILPYYPSMNSNPIPPASSRQNTPITPTTSHSVAQQRQAPAPITFAPNVSAESFMKSIGGKTKTQVSAVPQPTIKFSTPNVNARPIPAQAPYKNGIPNAVPMSQGYVPGPSSPPATSPMTNGHVANTQYNQSTQPHPSSNGVRNAGSSLVASVPLNQQA